jgi:hypothetical protein
MVYGQIEVGHIIQALAEQGASAQDMVDFFSKGGTLHTIGARQLPQAQRSQPPAPAQAATLDDARAAARATRGWPG